MSDVITNAKNWELATVRKTKNGKVYLSFDKNVKISVGDREVDLGEFKILYLDDAVDNLNFKLKNEYIDQDEYNTRLAQIEEKSIKSVLKGKLV